MRLQSIKPSLHIKQNAAEQMKMKHISPTKNETFSPKYAVTDLGLESKKKNKKQQHTQLKLGVYFVNAWNENIIINNNKCDQSHCLLYKAN